MSRLHNNVCILQFIRLLSSWNANHLMEPGLCGGAVLR